MSKRALAAGDRVRIQCVDSQWSNGDFEHFELSHFDGEIEAILHDKNGKPVYRISHDKRGCWKRGICDTGRD